MILKLGKSYELLKADLEILEDFSVKFRFPGDPAEKAQARPAYKASETVRDFVRQKLKLETVHPCRVEK